MHVRGGEDVLTLTLSGMEWQLGSPYALTVLCCKRHTISHTPLELIFINLPWSGQTCCLIRCSACLQSLEQLLFQIVLNEDVDSVVCYEPYRLR